jgi:hypothetical protein
LRENLIRDRRERLGSLAVALMVGILTGLWLKDVPLLQAANRTIMAEVQKRLGDDERDTRLLTLIDLSSAIGHREDISITLGEIGPDEEVLPSQSQVDFQLQLESLIELLRAVGLQKPRAIFVDWQTTAPRALWDPAKGALKPGVHAGFKDAFARFHATMDDLAETSPVFLVGDLMQDVVRVRQKTSPGNRHDNSLLSSELSDTEWYPYYPLAPMQSRSGSRLPSVTDGLIVFFELEDKVKAQPSKGFGLFEAMADINGQTGYWIDYGFAPSLVQNAIYLNNTEWTDPGLSKQLAERMSGKLVFIVDLTQPHIKDVIAVPARKEKLRVALPDGKEVEVRGSGGLVHACAFLTRTQEPLYAMPSGPKEMLLISLLSIAIAVVVWVISAIAATVSPKRWSKAGETGVELILLVAVTLFFVWFSIDWMAKSRVIIPQMQGFLVTRFVDTFLLACFLVRDALSKVPSAH